MLNRIVHGARTLAVACALVWSCAALPAAAQESAAPRTSNSSDQKKQDYVFPYFITMACIIGAVILCCQRPHRRFDIDHIPD